MSLFSGLYVGASGLVTNQNALNTTAHNLSNISTKGYTRQQTLQANRMYDTIGNAYVSPKQVGLGVSYADVRAVRDYFLDKAYRQELGRTEYYETNYNIVAEMETLFGELEGVAFQDSFIDFYRAVDELKKMPEDATNQALLVSKAQSFVERAQGVYNGLAEYQDNINIQIKETIDKINDYGKKIWELNQKITAIETGGIERANDYRDARDQLLDELGAFGRITYDEGYYGIVTVQFEGTDFVTQDYFNQMGYMTGDEYNKYFAEDIAMHVKDPVEDGFYVPVWPLYKNQDVFDQTEIISSDRNSDIGSLKALYNARGNRRATYKDLFKAGETSQDFPELNKAITIDGKEYIPYKDNLGHFEQKEKDGRSYDVSGTGKFEIDGQDYYIDGSTIRKGSTSGPEVGTIDSEGRFTIDGTDKTYKVDAGRTLVTAINEYTFDKEGRVYDVASDGKFTISGKDYYISDAGAVTEDSPTGPAVGSLDARGRINIQGIEYMAKRSGGQFSTMTAFDAYYVADDGTVTNVDSNVVVGKLGISEADSAVYFDEKTAGSSVMKVMAEFDNLVRGVVTGINKVLSSNGTYEGAEGDNLLFKRVTEDVVRYDQDGKEYIEKRITDGTDGWTTGNIMVNPIVQKTPTYLNNGFRLPDGSRDQVKADALARLFEDKYGSLNPDTGTRLDFFGYYSAIISENGTNGKVYRAVSENLDAMKRALDDQRQEVVGVSDSDELTQMIRYQNAYNASSRYINTVNSLLETLINSMR